jgi:hypothetical protein
MIPIEEGSAALGASVANPDPLGDVGSKKTWTATAVGGEAPYEYAFYVYEGGIRVHTQWYSSKASIDYTPTKPDSSTRCASLSRIRPAPIVYG